MGKEEKTNDMSSAKLRDCLIRQPAVRPASVEREREREAPGTVLTCAHGSCNRGSDSLSRLV